MVDVDSFAELLAKLEVGREDYQRAYAAGEVCAENGAEIWGMRVGGFKRGPHVGRHAAVVGRPELTDGRAGRPQVVIELL
jgi:hypothetical protein